MINHFDCILGSSKTSPARSRIQQLGQRLGNLNASTANIENDKSVAHIYNILLINNNLNRLNKTILRLRLNN